MEDVLNLAGEAYINALMSIAVDKQMEYDCKANSEKILETLDLLDAIKRNTIEADIYDAVEVVKYILKDAIDIYANQN